MGEQEPEVHRCSRLDLDVSGVEHPPIRRKGFVDVPQVDADASETEEGLGRSVRVTGVYHALVAGPGTWESP